MFVAVLLLLAATAGAPRVLADETAGEPPPAPIADATSVAAGPTLASVDRLVADYVRSVVRAAVVDGDGEVAACFCALAISVSFDGPTNAVATLGRVSGGSEGGASDARSGRSGDAMALSVTGGGSASATATSGDTGAVDLDGSSDLVAATGSTHQATTIDVTALTAALRGLVEGLGAETDRVADTDTTAQVADLLSGLPSPAPEGPPAEVQVAAWDRAGGTAERASGSGVGQVRCEPYDGTADVPSCALAVAVTGGTGAQATVVPPRLPASASTSGAGAPGMAAAISVAVSGPAVSGARTGDAGTRAPRAALLADDATDESALSTSAASSGDSGRSTAVALTVRGASTTTARSGDTGSALSTVIPAAAGTDEQSAAEPGAGGTATAGAGSGDSGDAVAITNGATGASSDSGSGDTGDAVASASDGQSGRDWSDPAGGGGGQVVGGTGGDAAATASTGDTGDSLSLVVSGGSAAATAASGPTGTAVADAVGGDGGDTHTTGSGSGAARSGDGGAAVGTGTSGVTGDAAAVLVTPYDGVAHTVSGRTGDATSVARGGSAGCASSGIDPARACRPAERLPVDEPALVAATVDEPAQAAPLDGDRALAAAARWQPVAADEGAADPSARERRRAEPDRSDDRAPVRVEVRSAGSADVTCVARSARRTCVSESTAPVRENAGTPSDARTQHGAAFAADRGTPEVVAVADASAEQAGPESPERRAADVSPLAFLVNAAVPALALLSLVAMALTARHRRAPRPAPHVAKHRRKKPLPHSVPPAAR